MINKITLIVIFTLLSNNIHSQTYFGLKVGANVSNIYGDNPIAGLKPAMHFGAVAEISISDFFSIQPELL